MTEAIFVQCEESRDYTPAGAVLAGEINQLLDGRAAVTPTALAAGQLGAQQMEGFWKVLCDTAITFTEGDRVYWDASANTAIAIDALGVGDFLIGTAFKAKVSGDLSVIVELNATGESDIRRAYGIVAASSAGGVSSTAEAILSSFTIPANMLRRGSVLKFFAQVIASATHSTDTFDFKVRLGGVTGAILWDSSAVDLADSDTGVVNGRANIRTDGASGTFVSAALGDLKTTQSKTVLGSTAVDTTAALALVVTVTVSASDAGNSARCDIFDVELVG